MAAERIGDWIQTFSGIAAYPFDLRPEEVELEDIAHSLSHICRFNGHTVTFFSVAEHSVRVCDAASPRAKPFALFHDSAETFFCDLASPVKKSLEGYKEAENRALDVILGKFDIEADEKIREEVHIIDQRIRIDERNQLMRPPIHPWGKTEIQPLGIKILPMSPDVAKRAFIATAQKLLAPWL